MRFSFCWIFFKNAGRVHARVQLFYLTKCGRFFDANKLRQLVYMFVGDLGRHIMHITISVGEYLAKL